MTVLMESEGESYEGKLAVAYVIVNRGQRRHLSLPDVVLDRLQFSCWNADSPSRMRLDNLGSSDQGWQDSYKATCSAIFGFEPDPTHGADGYLNEELTRKIRKGGLPEWFAESKVTARIGEHTFLRL